MIRTLLWKEYREQRATVVALLVFAIGLPVLVQTIVEPADAVNSPFGVLAISILCLTGLVVGGQAFAGELEGGTQAWLDAQPAWRRTIGQTKIAFSLAVLCLISVALMTLGVATNWLRPLGPADVLLLIVAGLSGLGCGLLGSTIGRSTLTAIGWGIVFQVLALIAMILIALYVRLPFRLSDQQSVFVSALITIPLTYFVAARRFHSPDSARNRDLPHSIVARSSWQSLLWLTWRQSRFVVALISLAGLAAAIFLPIHCDLPIWPAIGLGFGIVAGLSAFSPDRHGDAQRLLGDRRWPVGRVWLVKIAFSLMVALIPVIVQLILVSIQSFVRSYDLETSHASRVFTEKLSTFIRPDFLLLGPIYGFAIGQFLGMICRKGAVAFVLSAIVGVFALVAWWPSTVFGGLFLWQWMLPPLVLILTTRWPAWPWATGRLSEAKTIIGSIGAGLLATLLTVGGVAYRVVEVPDRAPPFDIAAFEKSLPTPEQNQAILKLTKVLRQFRALGYAIVPPIDSHLNGEPRYNWIIRASQIVAAQSWNADDEELNRKLDEFAAQPIFGELREAVALPLGMAEFSAGKPGTIDYALVTSAKSLADIVAARALQLASRGQADQAFDLLFVALDLGRQLQSRSYISVFLHGSSIEQNSLRLFRVVAESSGATSEVLLSALARLEKLVQSAPSAADAIKISYLTAARSIRNAGVSPNAFENEPWTLRNWAALAPWEIARSLDILNAVVAGYLRTAALTYPEAIQRIGNGPDSILPFGTRLAAWTPPNADTISAFHRVNRWLSSSISPVALLWDHHILIQAQLLRTLRRAAILQLAVAAFEVENGQPARGLSDLVPKYLGELPLDPYTMKSFCYRVSVGEQVAMNPPWNADVVPETTLVPAGVGVIWSTGGDMQDDGGFINYASSWGNTHFRPGRDLIFLAPAIRKPRAP